MFPVVIFLISPLLSVNSYNLSFIENKEYDCVELLINKLFGDEQTILLAYDDDETILLTRPNIRNILITFNVNYDVTNTTQNVSFNYNNYLLDVSLNNLQYVLQKIVESIYWKPTISAYGIFVIIVNGMPEIDYFQEMSIFKAVFIDFYNNCSTSTIDPLKDKIALKIANYSMGYVELFPFLYDMKNKVVNVQILPSFYQPPYMDTSLDPPGGLLLNAFHLWAEKCNVRIKFDTRVNDLFIQNKSDVGYEFWNNALLNGTMDVGAIYPMQFGLLRKVTATKIFMSQPFVWLIVKPKRLSNAQVIALTFNRSAWLSIVIAGIFGMIGWCLIDRKSIGAICFDVFRIFLCNGIANKPKNNVQRIWFVTLLLFAFVVNYIFQGQYSSYLTVPLYEEKIDTDEKLAKSNLIPSVHDIYKFHFASWNKTYANAFRKRILYTLQPFNHVAYVKEHPNVVVMTFPMMESIASARLDFLDVFTNTLLFAFEPRYLLRYGSIYTESLNNITQIVLEGGFVSKWQTDMRKVKFLPETNKFIRLNLDHIKCSVIILIVGLTTATIVFVFEQIINLMQRKKNNKF